MADSSAQSEKHSCVDDTKFESNGLASSNSTHTAQDSQPQTRPWYKTSNPLRWGRIPPVPDERIVSPEHKAGFLSRLTFGWVTPLMVVSLQPG